MSSTFIHNQLHLIFISYISQRQMGLFTPAKRSLYLKQKCRFNVQAYQKRFKIKLANKNVYSVLIV